MAISWISGNEQVIEKEAPRKFAEIGIGGICKDTVSWKTWFGWTLPSGTEGEGYFSGVPTNHRKPKHQTMTHDMSKSKDLRNQLL